MRESLDNTIWSLGIRVRNVAKRIGLLRGLEPPLLKLALLLVRPPSREVEINLPLGVKMVVPPGRPLARTLSSGLYEPDVTRLFQRIVKEDMTVVDLGANVGYYTLLASRLVGASGRVYAFEPDSRSYAYLVRNIETNGCENVIAVEKAVSDRVGPATLVLDEYGAEGWLSGSSPNAPSAAVETITLDNFFAQVGWPSIDVIKMDIEGSEPAALEGMSKLSCRNPDMKLLMEYNLNAIHRAGGSLGSLAGLLEELGFQKGYIIEQNLKPFQVTSSFFRTDTTYNLFLTK